MDIEEVRKKSVPIFEAYNVEYAAVFGSVARGEDRSDSDIDMIVRIGKMPYGIWGFVRLKQDLEAVFNKKVDLISAKALNKKLADTIKPVLKPIYERPETHS